MSDERALFRCDLPGELSWPEPGRHEVAACAAGASEIVSAVHGRAEFAMVGLRKLREGVATRNEVRLVHAQFQADCDAGRVRLLPLSEAVFACIEKVCASAPAHLFLRAGDALHLACAAENGFHEAFSNDRHFLAAAPLFGLRGVKVIPLIRV